MNQEYYYPFISKNTGIDSHTSVIDPGASILIRSINSYG